MNADRRPRIGRGSRRDRLPPGSGKFGETSFGKLVRAIFRPSKPIDQTLDLRARVTEIEQQAKPKPGCLQIVKALCGVDRIQRFDRLQFDQDRVLDQQIGCIGANDHAVVMDGHGMLMENRQASLSKLVRQCVLVHLFQEPGAERVRNGESASDNQPRKVIQVSFICVHPRSSVVADFPRFALAPHGSGTFRIVESYRNEFHPQRKHNGCYSAVSSAPVAGCWDAALRRWVRPGVVGVRPAGCRATAAGHGGRALCWRQTLKEMITGSLSRTMNGRAPRCMIRHMSDGLYERDILAWSQHQADLLRRLGRGERVNDVDWTHVAEEIEDVGLSELHSVESFLNLILVHLLKLYGWPDSQACGHWRGEIVAFRNNANRRFAPSMRQRIDIGALYAEAAEQLREIDPDTRLPDENPFTLDHLLKDDPTTLLSRFPAKA